MKKCVENAQLHMVDSKFCIRMYRNLSNFSIHCRLTFKRVENTQLYMIDLKFYIEHIEI